VKFVLAPTALKLSAPARTWVRRRRRWTSDYAGAEVTIGFNSEVRAGRDLADRA